MQPTMAGRSWRRRPPAFGPLEVFILGRDYGRVDKGVNPGRDRHDHDGTEINLVYCGCVLILVLCQEEGRERTTRR